MKKWKRKGNGYILIKRMEDEMVEEILDWEDEERRKDRP